MTIKSAFTEHGIKKSIKDSIDELKEIYLSDDVPWVIGYSGGKDSTAVTQLVWLMIQEVDIDKRKKPIFVITNDTRVENPIVSSWVNHSHLQMAKKAQEDNLPITPHVLYPAIKNSFWVNLIGKGYPAPRPKFRWCTERLKINPSDEFIRNIASEYGETILLLGVRSDESTVRAASMAKREVLTRTNLTAHPNLPNTLVASPIRHWTTDDVWTFLMRFKNPWGFSNKDLLTMYRGASDDSECPVVVDTSTPSCGNSRFGCWVCTLVDQDKSMSAMIRNDSDKDWMLPMLELRNEMDFRGEESRTKDRSRRDFRRMSGRFKY